MIKKAVIPAAGKGTRLLPVTKEIPKEMLPIFCRDLNKNLLLKPMLQQVFEELYSFGIREFCFIVGRGKRAIEDHFTSNYDLTEDLRKRKKDNLAAMMEAFYKKIDDSTIVLINQPNSIGFGDAVYRAKIFTQGEPFILHAGDDLILSERNNHIKKLVSAFDNYSADIIFYVENVEDPRQYGVIKGNEVNQNLIRVTEIIEKPLIPPSNLAIIALYVFNPLIYEAIEKIKPDEKGELQLADALQVMLTEGRRVFALKLESHEKRVDIGTPKTYLEMLKTTEKVLSI